MKIIREHPIKILSRMPRFSLLLIIPVFRALFYSGGSLQQWLKGSWIDILIVLSITGLGFLSWFFDLYSFEKNRIYRLSGMFLIKKTYYPIDKITSAIVKSPWYLNMFGLVSLNIDLASSKNKTPSLNLVLKKENLAHILKSFKKYHIVSKTNFSKKSSVFLFSILSSNGLTGILFISAFISQSGKIFGKEFEQQIVSNLTNTANSIIQGIPPIASILSIWIIAGWLVSLVFNLVHYNNFEVIRSKDIISIKCGIKLFKKRCRFVVGDINQIQMKQTILTKILKVFSSQVSVIGYGKKRGEMPVLIPIESEKNTFKLLEKILPEFEFLKLLCKPQKKDFKRFLTVPINILIGIILATALAMLIFQNFLELILFAGVMIAILDIIYLIIKILSFSHNGLAVKDDTVTAAFTRGFNFYTICLKKEKIARFDIRQSFFQTKSNCCTLKIYPYNQKRVCYTIINLPLDQVIKLIS